MASMVGLQLVTYEEGQQLAWPREQTVPVEEETALLASMMTKWVVLAAKTRASETEWP